MAKLTQAQMENLSYACGDFLAVNEKRPTTKGGAALVHAFWLGALTALNDRTNPAITLYLLSGRHAEICKQRPTP
jgi:hypothetical protein